MISLFFRENNQKYRIEARTGEDLLLALDKFLKKNKIKFTDIKNLHLRFFQEKSIISKRIAQSILKALKFASHS